MVARVKKNDSVLVVSGKDKGKQGTVLSIIPEKKLVMVKDVAIVSRHSKPRKQGETGGIKKQESYIKLSKVMPVCTACKKPSRIHSKVQDENRVRACSRCHEIF